MTPTTATEPRPLEPEDILLWRTAGLLALSPDGSRLAFVESWSDADSNTNHQAVFVVPTDGSAPARQVTFGANGDGSPLWSPDGRSLAFLSARETEWRTDLYILDMEGGGDARLVVRLPRGIMQYAWSPDGTKFVLTGRPDYPQDRYRPPSDDPAVRRTRYRERPVFVERLHYRNDGNRLVDDEAPWVWIAPTTPGESDPTALVKSTHPLSSPGWTPDGRVCFLSAREADYEVSWHNQLWAVPIEGGQLEQLTDSPGAVKSWCFTDDGVLAYCGYPHPGLSVGCCEHRLIVDGKVIDVEGDVGKYTLADTVDPMSNSDALVGCGTAVWCQVSIRGATHVYRSTDGGIEPIVTGNRVIGEVAVAGEVVAFTSTAPDEAASIRVSHLDGSGERVVHDPNPWIHDRLLSRWEEIWVEVDGVRAQAWVIFPPEGIGATPPPAVLSMHGGPHFAYGWSFNLLLQMLAAPGYSVVFGNPPGSTTYGEAFAQLTHKAWGEADFPIVMAYCDEVVRRGWGDADRLGVTGGSYGGFLTCWTVGHTDRFKAALAARPPINLVSIYGASEFGWSLMRGCFECEPWEDQALFRRLSPLTYAPNVTTPLRLIGCTEDYRVPLEQPEEMYITLKRMGKTVDLVVFRGSHSLIYFGPPWARVAHMDAMVEWFERYLV